MLGSKYPSWFTAWWIVNILITIAAVGGLIVNNFEFERMHYLYIAYICIWAVWANKYKSKFKLSTEKHKN